MLFGWPLKNLNCCWCLQVGVFGLQERGHSFLLYQWRRSWNDFPRGVPCWWWVGYCCRQRCSWGECSWWEWSRREWADENELKMTSTRGVSCWSPEVEQEFLLLQVASFYFAKYWSWLTTFICSTELKPFMFIFVELWVSWPLYVACWSFALEI